jgi:phosphohistidine phosphatase SixA
MLTQHLTRKEWPMIVTLLRHGVAVDRADPRSPPDFERPLTVEGRNRAESALRGLRALGVKPDRLLASPWVRCQQTARLAIQALGLPRRALVTSELLAPGVDPRAIWEHLATLGAGSILLVGHGGTLEPIAGVALGLPTHIPNAPAPTADLAYRTLALRKAGALQLEVRFSGRSQPLPDPEPPVPPELEPESVAQAMPIPADVDTAAPADHRGPVDEARLAWKLPARILRQIGR